jgi:hypothetical protein
MVGERLALAPPIFAGAADIARGDLTRRPAAISAVMPGFLRPGAPAVPRQAPRTLDVFRAQRERVK